MNSRTTPTRRRFRSALALGAALTVALTACGGPPKRVEAEPGRGIRIVGGGTEVLPAAGEKIKAIEADASNMVAMVMGPGRGFGGGSTIYMLHVDGGIFRSGNTGQLEALEIDKVGPITERGGLATGPDGMLYVVTDSSPDIVKIDLRSLERESLTTTGLPEGVMFSALTMDADDGTFYMGDSTTGKVYHRLPDGTAEELPRFVPNGCVDGAPADQPHPMPTSLALGGDGTLVVADSGCKVLYEVGFGGATYLAGVEDFPGAVATVGDCPSGASTGFFPETVVSDGTDSWMVLTQGCDAVWLVAPTGGEPELLVSDEQLDNDNVAIGIRRGLLRDGGGRIYLLDDKGVLSFEPTVAEEPADGGGAGAGG